MLQHGASVSQISCSELFGVQAELRVMGAIGLMKS